MKDFNSDYAIAAKQIEKAVTLIPRKLLVRENALDKNLSKSQDSDSVKLKKIYKLQQELAEKIAPTTHCRAGCTNCCHYNVDVLDVEAQLIAETYELKLLNPDTKNAGNHRGDVNFHGQHCIFLYNGQCSIYKARPFMCRKFTSFMPDTHWCHSEIHPQLKMPHITFSDINLAYSRLIKRHETRDIRQWFKMDTVMAMQENSGFAMQENSGFAMQDNSGIAMPVNSLIPSIEIN